MGAAASVRMVYNDALGWFKQYIDAETYMDDFKAMDKHNENALSFVDVRDWILDKSKKDPCWGIFLTSGPVLAIAHKNSCKHGDSSSCRAASKVVKITEFRTLLVHLFALSILWSHFQNADQWDQSGGDIGTKQLNFDAFKLACRTFASANAKEELLDEQILADFELLDENQSLTIGFVEVCKHCCKFIDDPEFEKKSQIRESDGTTNADGSITGLEALPKSTTDNATIEMKNHRLIQALTEKIADQASALKSTTALEHLSNIRSKYSTVKATIEHPICCGFLLKFCESQHNSEILSFILDVIEYREMFLEDTKEWVSDWKEIDVKSKISEENTGDDVASSTAEKGSGITIWDSAVNQSTATTKAQLVFSKYLNEDASNQVSTSNCVMKNTEKRMKFLTLYGPSLFDEVWMDHMTTLEKDIFPRFKISSISEDMLVFVALCEPAPPPPPVELKIPPPGNLLLVLSSFDSLSDARKFTLDEIIGCEFLYLRLLEYLHTHKGKETSSNTLKCIRKIDIFEELMYMNCVRDATSQATEILRYFVIEKSVHEVIIPKNERNYIMMSSADPKKGMFDTLRKLAMEILKTEFNIFKDTSAYYELAPGMRGLKIEMEKSSPPPSTIQKFHSLIWQKSFR